METDSVVEEYIERILATNNLENVQEINTGNDFLDYYLIYGSVFGLVKLRKKAEEWRAVKSNWSGSSARVDVIEMAIKILERKIENGKNRWSLVYND